MKFFVIWQLHLNTKLVILLYKNVMVEKIYFVINIYNKFL